MSQLLNFLIFPSQLKDDEDNSDDSGSHVRKVKSSKHSPNDENGSTNMDEESTTKQTAREKKVAEFLASLTLPAAVQAQMTSAPVAADNGLTEQKISKVCIS